MVDGILSKTALSIRVCNVTVALSELPAIAAPVGDVPDADAVLV